MVSFPVTVLFSFLDELATIATLSVTYSKPTSMSARENPIQPLNRSCPEPLRIKLNRLPEPKNTPTY